VESKLLSFQSVLRKTDELKKEGKRIVLCHGLFHFLHIGHIRYLREAKNYGDILIISVIPDKYIDKAKGVKVNEAYRSEALTAIQFADVVFINPFEDVYELLAYLKPDVFAQGLDGDRENNVLKETLNRETKRFKEIKVEHVIIKETDFSSTQQINSYLANLSEDTLQYVDNFKQRFTIAEVVNVLEKMRDLKVLVIGDTILDEYNYCSAIGKSSKDPTLALKHESTDIFAGGVLAVANHVAGLADHVDLVTILGQKETHEKFIRSKLKKNIRHHFLFKPNAPTLIKRRFLDGYSMTKLLEVYVMDDSTLNGEEAENLHAYIEEKLSECDLVIVADFGHGFIDGRLRKILSKASPFFAVNAQSNAGNRGFNNITQYSRADYVSLAEHEVRLELRDLKSSIRDMGTLLFKKMGCRTFAITRGKKGCMVFGHELDFVQVPAFATKTIDRVGAGDTFFAVTCLAAALDQTPIELIGFLGNIAGSIAVETMGNMKTVDNDVIIDYLQKILA
jgi:rfaE bifunctional protein kinase chain/domain